MNLTMNRVLCSCPLKPRFMPKHAFCVLGATTVAASHACLSALQGNRRVQFVRKVCRKSSHVSWLISFLSGAGCEPAGVLHGAVGRRHRRGGRAAAAGAGTNLGARPGCSLLAEPPQGPLHRLQHRPFHRRPQPPPQVGIVSIAHICSCIWNPACYAKQLGTQAACARG